MLSHNYQKPDETLLWWDTLVTTTYNGALTGFHVGGYAVFAPCFLGSFGMYGPKDENNFISGSVYVGALFVSPITVPIGAFFGLIFSLFYRYFVEGRKYLDNVDINNDILEIISCDSASYQQFLIEEILEEVRAQDSSRDKFRSYESAKLIEILKSETSLSDKSQALQDYLKDKSGDFYTNNGKKLFNSILRIGQSDECKAARALHLGNYDYIKDKDHEEAYESLLEKTNSSGLNYLHSCVINNDLDAITRIILNGEHIDYVNKLVNCPGNIHDGKNALYLAVELGHIEIAKALINIHATSYEKENKSLHPICVAAKHGKLSTVVTLLNLFSDCEKMQEVALREADRNKHYDISDYLANNLNVRDAETEKFKLELQALIPVILNNVWGVYGKGAFFTKLPDHIPKLRKIIEKFQLTPENIDQLTRQKIREVRADFQEFSANLTDCDDRDSITAKLYNCIAGIGRNTLANFKGLPGFDSGSLIPRAESKVSII